MINKKNDLLWKNIAALPYFRGYLRAVEGRFYDGFVLENPILDLGIGDGHFSATTLAGKIDTGVDPSFISLKEAQSYNAARSLCVASGDGLPFPDHYFSTIISNSVLEHIAQLDPVLREARRVLEKNGKFILCVPNDNFTQNLSIGVYLKKLGMQGAAKKYQELFNKISRHHHPDPFEVWKKRFQDAGFVVEKAWNYFSPKSMAILEWGHLFGIPQWINKKIFGKWRIFPDSPSLRITYQWLNRYFLEHQIMENGAYSFFILNNQ